jgi:uncharacterized protein (DUF1501 family)
MAITRRQFIRRTGWATAGALLGPSLFRSPWLQQAVAQTIGDRYLIVLFLDGGNDGLNTVLPATGLLRPHYEAARNTGAGGLRITNPLVPSNPMLDPNSGTQLGLHPGLYDLATLYDQNMVAVIQGCGYPDYNLSHDVARSIWESGSPLTAGGNGWMGRYLAAAGYAGSDIPAVNIGGSVAGEYLQTATSVLAFTRLNNFGFPYDFDFDANDSPDDTPFKDAAFTALYAAASANGHPAMQYLGGTGTATLLATGSYPALHDLYHTDRPTWETRYQGSNPNGLNTGTSRGFREIAKVIYGVANGVPNVNARFFELRNGGYDTHSDQGAGETGGQQYGLHEEVANAVKLFYDDLADMASGAPGGSGLANLPDKVCVLVWSEFSRRVQQNDNGTDHGSQGPMFVIGGGVNGGVYGNHPKIIVDENDPLAVDDNGNTVYSQDNANPYRSIDMRDVYGTVMKHWLGLANPAPLLPVDAGNPADYWTVADFDLGFLP